MTTVFSSQCQQILSSYGGHSWKKIKCTLISAQGNQQSIQHWQKSNETRSYDTICNYRKRNILREKDILLLVQSTWSCSLDRSITDPRGILYSSLNWEVNLQWIGCYTDRNTIRSEIFRTNWNKGKKEKKQQAPIFASNFE
jgi:hypothetical protein